MIFNHKLLEHVVHISFMTLKTLCAVYSQKWEHKLTYFLATYETLIKILPCENQDWLLLIQHFGNSAQVFIDLSLAAKSSQTERVNSSQPWHRVRRKPHSTHASTQLQCSRHTANIHRVHNSLKNENARGWLFFFFNHSERLSRWPPKQGVLMLMFPCQIAGLQIKLYIQQTFHHESTQYTTAVVFFYLWSLWL